MNGRTYLSFQEEDSYFFQIFFINFDSSLACLFSHSHLYQRNNSVAYSTWSGASSYLAPTFTKLLPDSTWTGATDRLPYYSASSTQHLEQYKKVVGRWRHSQQAIQPSTWSGASVYLAPSLTQLVPDPTWAGATDRLHYHSLLMFVFGANHYQACSGLDMDGRHW